MLATMLFDQICEDWSLRSTLLLQYKAMSHERCTAGSKPVGTTMLTVVEDKLQPGCRIILTVAEDERSRPSPGHGGRHFPLGQTQVDVRGEEARVAVFLHQGVDFALRWIETWWCRLRNILLNVLLGRVVNVNLEQKIRCIFKKMFQDV